MLKLTHREAQGYSPHPQTASADLRSCLEIPWIVRLFRGDADLFPLIYSLQGKDTNCSVMQYMRFAPATGVAMEDYLL